MENSQAIFVEAKSKNFCIIINHPELVQELQDGSQAKVTCMSIIPTTNGRNEGLIPDLKKFAARVSTTYKVEKLNQVLEFGSVPKSFDIPNLDISDMKLKDSSSYVNANGETVWSCRLTQAGQDKVALAFIAALESAVATVNP